ncbi:MAG: hypothetical protein M3348_07350, partial [Acidobacteriota bacterium]|nr:hypothetical protein [Acidobacteriota bacterium]
MSDLASTSGHEAKILSAGWLRTWAIAAALTLLLLGGVEAVWRASGFRPALNDDARLWAAARRRVRPDSTVLVGSSRMHADVRPATFAEVTGADTVQLAVTGGMSYPVLEDLARDPSFKGTVVCELSEVEISTGITTPLERDFVREYRRESPAGRAEAFLQRPVQERLALGLPQLTAPSVFGSLLRGPRPEPSAAAYSVAADRTLSVDFSKVDL